MKLQRICNVTRVDLLYYRGKEIHIMTTYNGYTKDLSDDEKRENEIEAIKSILRDDPTNEYWQNRLTALTCACFLYVGDNSECPVHGGMFKNHGAFSADEIKADYQERGELYAMGMGY
jgi:hypothetical protein